MLGQASSKGNWQQIFGSANRNYLQARKVMVLLPNKQKPDTVPDTIRLIKVQSKKLGELVYNNIAFNVSGKTVAGSAEE